MTVQNTSIRETAPGEIRPTVVVVGGFLGAGKTTLILAAARELSRRGLRSAAIFNDQGTELVDSSYAELAKIHSGEVVGGCFCCRLSDLIAVLDELRAYAPDVIFAEPVGSCTDIAATVIRPLQAESQSFRLAPATVLVDPQRAAELKESSSDPNMRFLFEKQLQEADIVCLTKSDLHPQLTEFETARSLIPSNARQLSAKSGQGIAAWLDEILFGSIEAGGRALDIDYAQYARAEAALAWLNAHLLFEPLQPTSPAMVLGPLFDDIDGALTEAQVPIVHLKAVIRSPEGFVKAAICANGDEPAVEGDLDASPVTKLELLLNLRAVGEPEQVRSIVERQLQKMHGEIQNLTVDCFSPAAPVPERRIAK